MIMSGQLARNAVRASGNPQTKIGIFGRSLALYFTPTFKTALSLCIFVGTNRGYKGFFIFYCGHGQLSINVLANEHGLVPAY